jgi:hypothetical protein
MEQQILSTLQEIKTAIYVLMAIVVLGVVASFLRAGIAAKSLLRGKLDESFEMRQPTFLIKAPSMNW